MHTFLPQTLPWLGGPWKETSADGAVRAPGGPSLLQGVVPGPGGRGGPAGHLVQGGEEVLGRRPGARPAVPPLPISHKTPRPWT